MTDEIADSWKNFVTNLTFETYLKQVIDSLTSPIEGQHKSIWVEGTFGTGKSHSSSVVKHLLSDDYELVEPFIRNIEDPQVRSQIEQYRKTKRVFPVVLKGICNIKDAQEMCIQIQKAVKAAFTERNINLTVETDFEKTIAFLEDPAFDSFLSSLIEHQFAPYGYSKADVIKQLKEQNLETLATINEELKRKNLSQVIDNSQITNWLTLVSDFLTQNGIADDLMIFWDEFTPLLTITEKRAILSVTQNIAELSKTKHVFLFIITHIDIEATEAYKDLSSVDQELLKDRFKTQRYDAQYDTVYQILSASLDAKNPSELDRLIEERVKSDFEVSNCIQKLIKTSSHPDSSRSKLEHLYPIHPYTSFAATFLARNVGSSERSVFDFLTDPDSGFKKFLGNEITDKKFVTLDYIWDFFQQKLEDSATFADIVNCYRNNRIAVEEASCDYLRVLKGILLLNALQSNVSLTNDSKEDQSVIAPYYENIIFAFAGEIEATVVQSALEFFDNRGIIRKGPDEKYEISLNTVPSEQVQAAKQALAATFKTVVDFENEFKGYFSQIKSTIEKDACLRRNVHVEILSPSMTEQAIITKLTPYLDNDHHGQFFLGLFISLGDVAGQKEPDADAVKELATKLLAQKAFAGRPVAFAFVKGTTMRKNVYEGIISDLALKKVLEENDQQQQAILRRQSAEKWLKQFVEKILKEEDCQIFYSATSIPTSFPKMAKTLKDRIIKQVFKDGLDDLEALPSTSWQSRSAPGGSLILTVMQGDKGKIKKNLQPLFSDNYNISIFDDSLNLTNPSADTSVAKLVQLVAAELNKRKNETIINLPEIFSFIFKPPYGYGLNDASFVALALAFKPFSNQIYTTSSGEILDSGKMSSMVQDLINHCVLGKSLTSKLSVRFSTEESRRLSEELSHIFNLSKTEADGLVAVKWDLRDSFKKHNKAPVWILKYYPKKDLKLSSLYDSLYQFTFTMTDDISEKDISNLLSLILQYKIELMNAVQELKNEDLMRKYITEKFKELNPEATDTQITECLGFVKTRSPDDIVFWEERDVNGRIEAYSDSLRHTPTPIPGGNGDAPSPVGDDPIVIEPNESSVNSLRTALYHREINNDELKELLFAIGKEHPELIPEIIRKIG